MEQVTLGGLKLSRIVHGHWRQREWNLTPGELLRLAEHAAELGITSFDHADIYGGYSCEKNFGDALKLKPGFRKSIQIVTKCGIRLVSDKFQGPEIKHYDYSFRHIVNSVEQSLLNFGTDHVDLLLLHRPSPFFDPEEVARAFSSLKRDGKVLFFGVSNFNPLQFEMLNAYWEDRLITNQVEISPYCLEHFDNGNIDFFTRERIRPMAWSPLGGDRFSNPRDDKDKTVLRAVAEVAEELNTDALDQVILSWVLSHPAVIVPVVGTGRPERLKAAAAALELKMDIEQWFKIYNASRGEELP
jgi:predicted oxidoreductase